MRGVHERSTCLSLSYTLLHVLYIEMSTASLPLAEPLHPLHMAKAVNSQYLLLVLCNEQV